MPCRLMWESHPEQAEAYRQYLKDHAEEFGLRAEDIAALQSPVLVNMLHVDDATAIPLGQYVAQDTEKRRCGTNQTEKCLTAYGNRSTFVCQPVTQSLGR